MLSQIPQPAPAQLGGGAIIPAVTPPESVYFSGERIIRADLLRLFFLFVFALSEAQNIPLDRSPRPIPDRMHVFVSRQLARGWLVS